MSNGVIEVSQPVEVKSTGIMVRGATGNGIASIEKTGTSGEIDTYTITFTDGNTTTFQITNGIGISNIEQTTISQEDGGINVITITLDNGTTKTFQVRNGSKGSKGDTGEDGVSPVVEISKSGKITTITITDAEGTHTATIRDGEDGQGSGDMLKSTYDVNNNGIVDNAEKVNNHTVEKDVPSNAVFTDTVYDDTAIQAIIANKVDKVAGKGLSTNDFTNAYKDKVDEVDSKAPLKKTWNITVDTTWTGTSAPYTKQITTTGMLSTYKPQAKLIYSGSNVETSIAEDEAYSKISRIDSNNGSITLTCFEEVPDRALSLEIEVSF